MKFQNFVIFSFQSGLHLKEYGTNNFCYNLIEWWDGICLGRNTTEKSVKLKKVNGDLTFNFKGFHS